MCVCAWVCTGVCGMGLGNVCQCVGHGMFVSLDSVMLILIPSENKAHPSVHLFVQYFLFL